MLYILYMAPSANVRAILHSVHTAEDTVWCNDCMCIAVIARNSSNGCEGPLTQHIEAPEVLTILAKLLPACQRREHCARLTSGLMWWKAVSYVQVYHLGEQN